MKKFPLAVCTWSLGAPIGEVCNLLRAMEIDQMNISLRPAIKGDEEYLETAKTSGIKVSATMLGFPWENYKTLETIRETGGVAPDEHWPEALDMFKRAAKMTVELNTVYLAAHAGFIDHGNPVYAKKFYDRIRAFGDIAGENGIYFLLETGQETGDDLRRFLEELNHERVFLNLDPANLILYNKDKPLDALPKLAPWIRHVHAKDAIHGEVGKWGREVPWGEGEVNSFAFLKKLDESGFDGTIAIEREGGPSRIQDIAKAIKRIRAY